MSRRGRTIALLLLLVVVGGYYVYQNSQSIPAPEPDQSTHVEDQSASLGLDEETKAKIRHYFEGVSIDPKENTLDHAISLDHSVGRPQLAQGKYREAYGTYKKVLAISYRQGSLMGIGIALNILADAAYRANQLDEALFTTLLAYKVAQAMKNKEPLLNSEWVFLHSLKITLEERP